MKTKQIYTALVSFSLVIFMSATGISNPAYNQSEDNLEKSGNKVNEVTAVSHTSTSEFSYLRFDVNTYTTEATANELPVNTFDYLRFDINAFTESTGSEIMEMPVASEFEYLRFDVTEYSGSTGSDLSEMPVADEFDYLRFDVNAYTSYCKDSVDELLATE